MTRILTVSGSPFPSSRTELLAEWLAARIAGEGFDVRTLYLRDLPPDDLLGFRTEEPALHAALRLVEKAHGVVLVTPVHKAAYSGLLKVFLDVLPQHGFDGKVIFPMAVGGSMAHALAIDYGLWPVLASMGSSHVISSVFVHDRLLERTEPGGLKVECEIEKRIEVGVREFSLSLRRHHHGPHGPLAGRHGKRDGVPTNP
jgi:FMN reductase